MEDGHTIFYRDNITDVLSTLHKTALVGRWNNNEPILNWGNEKYEAPTPDIPCSFFTTVLPAVNSKYDFNLPFIRTHKLNNDNTENAVIHEGIRGPYRFFNYTDAQLPKLSGKYLNNDEYVGENNVVFYMKSTNVITTPYLATITINTETNTSNNTDDTNQDISPIMLLNDESIPEKSEKSENTQSEVKTIIKPNAQNFMLDSNRYLNTTNIKFTNITGHELSALNHPDDYYDNEYNKPDKPDKPDEPQPIYPIIDKDSALKIIAQDNNVVIKFTPSEQYTGLIYQTSNMENAAYYTSGQEIMLSSKDEYVWFENTKLELDNLSNSIGKFNITGTVILEQDIQSLLKYSDSCTPYCYQELFSECTGLVSAHTLSTTTILSPYCYSGMFRCCSGLVSAPELPATNLTEYCYRYMFEGCSKLTTAPDLPATTLLSGCYYGMFNYCTSLNYVNVGFTDWNSTESSTSGWLQNVSSTGTFVCSKDLNRKPKGPNYIPDGWKINIDNADDSK